jgi:release factor glutamine methyltransferase
MGIDELEPGATLRFSALVAAASDRLKAFSGSAELDSRLIVRHTFQLSESRALGDPDLPMTEGTLRTLREMIVDRARGVPVAYLLGTREFCPESELLVGEGVGLLRDRCGPFEILDLGTGSGAIAVAVASELRKQKKDFRVTAIDRSKAALEVAAKNVAHHGLSEMINLREGDWLLGFNPRVDRFDLIVANPPYISRFEKCPPELFFEPAEALFSEQGGLADVRRLIAEVGGFLKSEGVFLCEFGCGKRAAVREILEELKRPNRWEFIGDLDRGDGFTVLKMYGTD